MPGKTAPRSEMTAVHEPATGSPTRREPLPEALPEAVLRRTPEPVALATLLPSDGPRTTGLRAKRLRALMAAPDGALPPIVVHAPTRRVIDGMHRLEAARRRGAETVDAVFFDGEESAALVLALRLNAAGGLPLSLADRKRAAARLIEARPAWPDRVLASMTGLAPATVAALRRPRPCPARAVPGSGVGPDGRTRPVSGEDRRRMAGEMLALNPKLSPRQVARALGVPPETVRAIRQSMQARKQPRRTQGTASGGTGRVKKPARAVGTTRKTTVENPSPPPDRYADLIERLKADPSLRSSDAGRSLLRLLALHSALDAEEWNRIAEQVPAHRLTEVAELAAACAQVWSETAARLTERTEQ